MQEPRSRRPQQSPSMLTHDVARHAVGVRAALEQSELDHDPISVQVEMRSLGDTVPSTGPIPASTAKHPQRLFKTCRENTARARSFHRPRRTSNPWHIVTRRRRGKP